MAKTYRYRMPHNDYAGEVETHGFTAANATPIKPEIIPGFWPRWNGEAWEQIEDHRKRATGGAVPSGAEQDATEYWLPGDTWNSPARRMVEIGPLPEGALLEAPEMPVAEAVATTIAEVMGGYAAAFAPVEAMYPANEREGWTIQLEEARAVLADENADAPTLTALVEERGTGETLLEFAQTVFANNAMYRAVYAKLTGQQQRMYRDVMSMAAMEGITTAQVLAYPIEYEMPEGM